MTAALAVFAARATDEEIAGRVIFDVAVVALAIWLLASAYRRERTGIRSTGRYVAGAILIVAILVNLGRH